MSVLSNSLFHRIFGGAPAPDPRHDHRYMQDEDRGVLLALCRVFRPQTVIEIGVQRGATARQLLDGCPFIRHYIGIDVPPATRMPLPGQQSEVPAVAGEFASGDVRFRLSLRHGLLDLKPADLPRAGLVLIDGDHSAAAVRADTALARAVLWPGGIIAWHDYGNRTVEVTGVIDALNRAEGDRICHVEPGMICFEIRQGEGNA